MNKHNRPFSHSLTKKNYQGSTVGEKDDTTTKDKKTQLKLRVLSVLIELVSKGTFKGQEEDPIRDKISSNLNTCTFQDAADLISKMIKQFTNDPKNNVKLIEFIPSLFNRIPDESSLEFSSYMETGHAFKNKIVQEVIDCKWDNKRVLPIASFFKEVRVDEKTLERVISKFTKCFSDVKLAEFPVLIQQLLLITESSCHRMNVLKDISDYFYNTTHKRIRAAKRQKNRKKRTKNKQASQEILEGEEVEGELGVKSALQMEDTVILHFDFAIKQDVSLGEEFFKMVQKNVAKFSPFNIAILLCMTRVLKFTEKVHTFLKQLLVDSLKTSSKSSGIEWIAKCSIKATTKDQEISSLILETAELAKEGKWGITNQPLTIFGFKLLDIVPGKLEAPSMKEIYEFINRLGVGILVTVFDTQKVVQSEVLDQITSRLLNNEAGKYHVQLLANLVEKYPSLFKHFVPKIKSVFEYLSYIKEENSKLIISALSPLILMDPQLKDHFIINTRKMLFTGECCGKVLAVHSLETLCKEYSKQIESTELNRAENEQFQKEMIRIMTKSLMQPQVVRIAFYNSLPEVMTKSTAASVIELLISHLSSYCEIQGEDCQFNIDACLDINGENPIVAEPVWEILRAISNCASLINSGEIEDWVDKSTWESWQIRIGFLAKSFPTLEPADFKLEKDSNFDGETVEGKRNILRVKTLINLAFSIIDASNNMLFFAAESVSWFSLTLEFVKKLKEMIKSKSSDKAEKGEKKSKKGKEKEGNGKGKSKEKSKEKGKTKKSPFAQENLDHLGFYHKGDYVLGCKMLNTYLGFMTPNTEKSEEEEAAMTFIKKDKSITETIFKHLTNWVTSALANWSTFSDQKKASIADQSRLAAIHVMKQWAEEDLASVPEKVHQQLIQIYFSAFEIQQLFDPTEESVASWLDDTHEPVAKNRKADDPPQVIFIDHQKWFLERFKQSCNNTKTHRELQTILSLITSIAKLIPDYKHYKEFIKEITNENISQLPTVKDIFSFALTFADYAWVGQVANAIKRVHEEKESATFIIITKTNYVSVSTVLHKHIDKLIEEIELAIHLVKTDSARFDLSTFLPKISEKMKEMMKLLERLLECDVTIEVTFKSTVKFYKSLTSFTKFLSTLPNKPPDTFKELCHKLGPFREVFAVHFTHNIPLPAMRLKKFNTVKPSLIFEVEKFEALLLKYSKKHDVLLTKDWKKSSVVSFKFERKQEKEEGEDNEKEDVDQMEVPEEESLFPVEEERPKAKQGKKRKNDSEASDELSKPKPPKKKQTSKGKKK